jgi:ABC-type antimicrobial peptide transport system permease subunit
LKNKFATERIGGFSLRKVLVVAQFTMTQILVVSTFVVVMQMRFFQDTDLGFVHDAIINVSIPENDAVKRETLEQQLRSQSFVSAVSSSYTLPGGESRNRSYRDIRRSDATIQEDVKIYEFQSIDTSFLNLYKIKLLAGRNFQQSDSARYIILNKNLAKDLQLGEPDAAVGKLVTLDRDNYTVIGIVNNVYANSLKEGVGNIGMIMNPRAYRNMSIKFSVVQGRGSLTDLVNEVEKLWKATYPEFIFEYTFLDENVRSSYAQEQKHAQLFELFSFTFLLIGCLGLFGLITFVVNRKGKEIAVRKVLGADVPGLLFMFSKEYVKLIFISLLLAVPVTYYLVNDWLSTFVNRIELQWWLFATPGFIVLLIAVLVVCLKSAGAANRNPVEALRCE